MDPNLRETGIDFVDNVPWGAHLCFLYKSKHDFREIVLPYIIAGLHNNEACLWIASDLIQKDEAETLLRDILVGYDDYVASGQLHVESSDRWYFLDGVFDPQQVLEKFSQKQLEAIDNGFDGLRVAGDFFDSKRITWDKVQQYENLANDSIGNTKVIALCLYSVDKLKISEIVNVGATHQSAIIKRDGKWFAANPSAYEGISEILKKDDSQ